jgi:hypothetical protein
MAYVAGPVIREGTPRNPWVRQCYDMIEQAATIARQQATLPLVEYRLETASPRDFSQQILGRIRDARSVVAVFLPNDPSTPVECALAVGAGKRVLILHQEGVRLPRILAGLPGVETLDFDRVGPGGALATVTTFLREQRF